MLNVVEFGELAAVIRCNKLLKFFERLVAEIATVDQKHNTPCAGEFNQPINKIGSGVCFAATSRHLHKRAAFVFGKRFLKVPNRVDLCRPKISRRHLIAFWKIVEALTELRGLLCPVNEYFWPMKGKNISARRASIEPIGESCFCCGGLVGKWQRIAPFRVNIEQTRRVFSRLLFNTDKRVTLGLCFHSSQGLTIAE